MPLISGWASNKGVVREENQDCCYISVCENSMNSCALAVMCDGMGGLDEGAYASRLVCGLAQDWFALHCDPRRQAKASQTKIAKEMSQLLREANDKLVQYGTKRRIQVGTTASLLLLHDGQYIIAHVGDTRVYRLSASLMQLTDDDNVAWAKLRRGEISQLEYDCSREKNMLTQCVGVNRKLDVHTYSGSYSHGDVFFLCTDGMYHNMEADEVTSLMYAQRKEKGSQIIVALEKNIDKMISRGETDNLTGIIVCAV